MHKLIGKQSRLLLLGLLITIAFSPPLAMPLFAANPLKPAIHNLPGWTGMVFQTLRHGNWEIYLLGLPEGERRLTNHSAADTLPRLNQGGTKVTFVSNRDGNDEIYAMGIDGSAQTRLTDNGAVDTTPQWSPDGQQLLFTSYRSGNGDIYLMNADGSNQQTLSTNETEDIYPTWSPDGSLIAWVQLYPKERDRPQFGELWQANADGSNAHALTGRMATPARPLWSPDGTKLAFDADLNEDGYQDVVIGDSNGSNLQIYLGGAPSQRWWMGSWALDSAEIFVTERNYSTNGSGERVLVNTRIRQFCLDGDPTCEGFSMDDTEMLPDIQSLDTAAPISQVEPLPNYSRLNGFVINWSGHEIGPSGLAGYDIAYRHENDSEWTMWHQGTAPNSDALPTDPAGERGSGFFAAPSAGRYYFRSRAADWANNFEAWPETAIGDASTTVFSWYLSGQVTDNRAHPESQYAIPLEPLPLDGNVTDSQGNFQMRIGMPGSYTMAEAIQLEMDRDQRQTYYRLPSVNAIQNSGFEEPMEESQWIVRGTVAALTGAANVHSGNRALQLGGTCEAPCTLSIPIENATDLTQIRLIGAADGTLHLFARKQPSSLIHQIRTADGRWLAYTILANGIYDWTPSIQFDQQGNLHLAWSSYEYGTESYLHYARYGVGTGWSQPVDFGRGANPSLTIDNQQRPHMIYQCEATDPCPDVTLYYRTIAANGSWKEPTQVVTTWALRGYAIAAVGNTLYVAWGARPAFRQPEQLLVSTTVDGQSWEKPTVLDAGDSPIGITEGLYQSLQLLRDQQNTLHMSWMTPRTNLIHYSTKPQHGTWSPAATVQIPPEIDNFMDVSALISNDNTFHLFGAQFNGQPLVHWQRKDDEWSDPKLIVLSSNGESPDPRSIALTNEDLYYVVGDFSQAATIKTTRKVSVTEQSTLAQSVHISSALHQPTLAFLYQLDGDYGVNLPNFFVTVTQQITTTNSGSVDATAPGIDTTNISRTTVYSASTAIGWQLGWANMTPWQGETVTVTFGFAQQEGSPYRQVRLDQVTLGSWQTPLAQRVEPNRVDVGKATAITIHGTNFLATPKVWVGQRQLQDVMWQDEQTLRATLPADLLPGVYTLIVENPSGERYHLQAAIGIGKQVYLPIVE